MVDTRWLIFVVLEALQMALKMVTAWLVVAAEMMVEVGLGLLAAKGLEVFAAVPAELLDQMAMGGKAATMMTETATRRRATAAAAAAAAAGAAAAVGAVGAVAAAATTMAATAAARVRPGSEKVEVLAVATTGRVVVIGAAEVVAEAEVAEVEVAARERESVEASARLGLGEEVTRSHEDTQRAREGRGAAMGEVKVTSSEVLQAPAARVMTAPVAMEEAA